MKRKLDLPRIRMLIRDALMDALRQLLRGVHPLTLIRTLAAILRGGRYFISWSYHYLHASDKLDIKGTTNGPDKHHDITQQRRMIYLIGLGLALVASGLVVHRVEHGDVILGLSLIVALFCWGRVEPVAVATPQVGRNATESLIKDVTNQLTLTAELKKAEESCALVQPVHSIPSGTGYTTVIDLPGLSAKKAILGREDEFAAKIGAGNNQVHLTGIRNRASRFGLLVLYDDPYDRPPTRHPLVVNPAQVDLWNDKVEMGTMPTQEPYRRKLIVPGGGGGALIGAAPRYGKTTTANNLIVPVLLDPYAMPLFIDGKGVDWKPCAPLAWNGVYVVRNDHIAAIEALELLVAEIDQRSVKLESLGLTHITETVTREHGMPSLWLFLDELSIYTEDAPKPVRDAFLGLLGTVCRLGPTFGVYLVACTQRPTEKGVPPGIRDLLYLRIALYCLTPHASMAILGQGGEANRADRLSDEDDQKGVAIVRGDGMMRTHSVDVDDLKRVVRYAQSIRSMQPTGGPPPPVDAVRPPVIEASIQILNQYGNAGFIDSATLAQELARMNERLAGLDTASLARMMGERFGIRPTQATKRQHPQRLRGYLLEDLEAVPFVARPTLRSVPNTQSNAPDTSTGTEDSQ